MRVLLTGGHGYLGSRLAFALDACGHQVISIDRLDGDLSEPGVFFKIFERWLPLDRVVHLAATPGREFCEREPEMAIKQNTTMTMLVARTCGANDVPLCYVSTSEVYGATMDIERYVNEDDDLAPRNTYALSKVWGEDACHLYAPDSLVVLRPSMPFCGEQPVGFGRAALPTMVHRALRGEDLEVHRGTSRSWTYVTDVIDGMVIAIEHGEGIFNVGNEAVQLTMHELANTIIKLTDSSSKIVFLDPPRTVSPHKRLSSARLRALGWWPKVTITEGVNKTIKQLQQSCHHDEIEHMQ